MYSTLQCAFNCPSSLSNGDRRERDDDDDDDGDGDDDDERLSEEKVMKSFECPSLSVFHVH